MISVATRAQRVKQRARQVGDKSASRLRSGGRANSKGTFNSEQRRQLFCALRGG